MLLIESLTRASLEMDIWLYQQTGFCYITAMTINQNNFSFQLFSKLKMIAEQPLVLVILVSLLSSPSFSLTLGLSPDEIERQKLERLSQPPKVESSSEALKLSLESIKAEPPLEVRDGKLIIVVSNDAFSINLSDRHLTSRLRIGYISKNIPKRLQSYLDSKNYFVLTLSQDIYTPDDIENAELIEDDRPYAGWLYLTIGKMKKTENTISITTIDIGMVGPSARAEEAQTKVHDWTSSDTPRGWSYQLADELGFNINHQKMYRNQFALNNIISGELLKFYGAKLGNIRTSVSVGAMSRLGYNLPNDFGVGFDEGRNSRWTIFGYVRVEGEYVLRDIFLDGNTFRQSHSVEKENFIADLTTGLTIQKGDWGASIIQTLRTEEFEGQDGGDSFAEFRVFYNIYFK